MTSTVRSHMSSVHTYAIQTVSLSPTHVHVWVRVRPPHMCTYESESDHHTCARVMTTHTQQMQLRLVMSHVWMNHDTHESIMSHTNESCYTYERVMPQMNESHKRRRKWEQRVTPSDIHAVTCTTLHDTLHDTLQHTATHCTTHCNTLQHTAPHCETQDNDKSNAVQEITLDTNLSSVTGQDSFMYDLRSHFGDSFVSDLSRDSTHSTATQVTHENRHFFPRKNGD